MYIEKGAVRLSVVSHSGKEAVLALIDAGDFFGEECLAGRAANGHRDRRVRLNHPVAIRAPRTAFLKGSCAHPPVTASEPAILADRRFGSLPLRPPLPLLEVDPQAGPEP